MAEENKLPAPLTKIYVPEQRTLFRVNTSPFDSIHKRLLSPAKSSAGSNEQKMITYDGSNVYYDVLTFRNSTVEAANDFEMYEQFLSKYFFEQKRIKIVPSQYDANNNEAQIKELQIKIGDEREFPIYQLGTGLQGRVPQELL